MSEKPVTRKSVTRMPATGVVCARGADGVPIEASGRDADAHVKQAQAAAKAQAKAAAAADLKPTAKPAGKE